MTPAAKRCAVNGPVVDHGGDRNGVDMDHPVPVSQERPVGAVSDHDRPARTAECLHRVLDARSASHRHRLVPVGKEQVDTFHQFAQAIAVAADDERVGEPECDERQGLLRELDDPIDDARGVGKIEEISIEVHDRGIGDHLRRDRLVAEQAGDAKRRGHGPLAVRGYEHVARPGTRHAVIRDRQLLGEHG